MNKKIAIELVLGIILIVAFAVGGALYFINKNIGNVSAPMAKQDAVIPYCEDLDISDEQLDEAVEEALVGLKNPWGNIKDEQIMVERMEKKLGCKLSKDSEMPPVQPKPTSGMENWQTYQNEEYGFEIRYPEGFAKQEGELLYVMKKEISSDVSLAVGVEKDYYQFDSLPERLGAKEKNIEGRKGYIYFYGEGAGYSGVLVLQLENGYLSISYDHIGSGGEKVVPDNFGKILSTLKFAQ